jgi:CBS domain containing-hemolysin-like protein
VVYKLGVFRKIISNIFFWRNKKYIEEKIEAMLTKAQRNGFVDASSREMIENILAFTHILVREIMIPRTQIVSARKRLSRKLYRR